VTRVAWSPITVPPDTLVSLDADRRLYAGLSRDGSYYHLIRPLRDGDYRVRHEGGIIGALACDCVGFSTHGKCYQASAAIALEAELADQAAMPEIFRRPVAAETELEKAAARG
jgi:hypothetical protein